MKNSNELKSLLDFIQAKTRQSFDEIAEKIGISKAHLIRSKNNPDINSEKTIGRIKVEYAKVLKDRILEEDKLVVTVSERLKAHDALLHTLVLQVASQEIRIAQLQGNKKIEPLQSLVTKIYEAAQDAGENLP